MKRREFIALLGGTAATLPLTARAQQTDPVRRIGVLMSIADDPEGQSRVAALRQGLRELRWIEGQNVQIDIRWTNADVARSQAFAAELVAMKPDVLVAHAPSALAALQQQAGSVPIVFVQVPDPVEAGFVTSMARPGGNITGFTHYEHTMGGKWLNLLKEIAPQISRVLVMQSVEARNTSRYLETIKVAAPSFGVQLTETDVNDVADIERAIDVFAREPNGGLIAPPSLLTTVHYRFMVALQVRHKLPAVYAYRFFPVDGGLMSYGVDLLDLFQRSASYVDRILKGEKPADLPVQAPTKFRLVLNLKAAKALGLTVPNTLLVSADEVIE